MSRHGLFCLDKSWDFSFFFFAFFFVEHPFCELWESCAVHCSVYLALFAFHSVDNIFFYFPLLLLHFLFLITFFHFFNPTFRFLNSARKIILYQHALGAEEKLPSLF